MNKMTHAQAQRMLVAHAEGRVSHIGMGQCPDCLEGHDVRDSECPVCQALVALSLGPQTDGDGSKAWAGVKDATQWVDEQRGSANAAPLAKVSELKVKGL